MSTKEKTGRAPAKPQKKAEKEAPRPLQDVVYMPPKPFMRNRLLLRLATVVAIVLALVLAMLILPSLAPIIPIVMGWEAFMEKLYVMAVVVLSVQRV